MQTSLNGIIFPPKYCLKGAQQQEALVFPMISSPHKVILNWCVIVQVGSPISVNEIPTGSPILLISDSQNPSFQNCSD
jgi:hypothetical protein